jgi:hypothetical protein
LGIYYCNKNFEYPVVGSKRLPVIKDVYQVVEKVYEEVKKLGNS